MRVFLVEDSRPILGHLRAVVADIAGAAVVGEAMAEDEAVDGICATRPDAVVLDLRLAAGSGIEVLRRTKALLPQARIIVLTNQTGSLYRKRCLALGADGFLDKSREFGILVRHLKELATPAS